MKKQNRGWWLFLFVHFAWAASSSYAQVNPLEASLDALMQAYERLEQFSGSVLVARQGDVIYRAGIGWSNRELGVAAAPEHRFIIGSMTKAFTAVLVLQQVDEGQMELDQPVVRYWPDFPDPSGGQITVRHLLTHQAGLPHWGAVEGFLNQDARLTNDPHVLLNRYAAQGLRFPPGTREGYSSLGYFALGLLLEQVTGRSYAQLLKERIFTPLAMENSELDDYVGIRPGRATAYRYSFLTAQYDNAEYRDPSTTFSTGGILTTIDDLLKWDQALYTDRLLPDTLRALLFDRATGRSAYGWRKGLPERTGTIVWHGGLVTGYRSQITRVLDTQTTIILLGNLRDINTVDITTKLLDVVAGASVEPPKASLMKEVLRVVAAQGVEAAALRFRAVIDEEADTYQTDPFQLLLAAIELRSDEACDRAAPLYELWVETYGAASPLRENALHGAADCRLRLRQWRRAQAFVDRLAEAYPESVFLEPLQERLR